MPEVGRVGKFRAGKNVRLTESTTSINGISVYAGEEAEVLHCMELNRVQLRLLRAPPYREFGYLYPVLESPSSFVDMSEMLPCGRANTMCYGDKVMTLKQIMYPLSNIMVPPCTLR